MQTIAVYDADGNTLDNLVQWDRDIYVYIEHPDIDDSYNLHFFNQHMTESLVVESFFDGSQLRAKIPNTLLEESYAIIGYINITKHNEEKCLYGFRINVIHKPQPSNVVTPDSQDYIKVEDVLDECRDYADRTLGFSMDAFISADRSESYAVGGTGTREGEDEDNSKYYCEQAALHEESAAASEQVATQKAGEAEASAQAAKKSEDAAKESETNADDSEAKAADSAAAALASEGKALASEQAAKKSEDASAKSEENSKASEDEAARLLQTTQDLADQVEADRAEVAENLTKAQGESAKAETSAQAAKQSEDTALEHELAAEQSATNAAASEKNTLDAEGNVLQVLDDILNERYVISNYEASIPSQGWSEAGELFTITVPCIGILEADDPFIDIIQSGDYTADKPIIAAWGSIIRIETADKQLIVYANEVPEVDIPIRVKAVR